MKHPSLSSRRHLLWSGLALVVLLVGVAALVKWALRPMPRALHLADGTEVFFLSDTKITPAAGYPQPREIQVDGDAFFRVEAAAQPLIVRSRLLVLTVTGETAFRMTAYSRQTGEQVEVLYGHAVAHKAYDSPYAEPDTLTGGEMVMINRTIDLMEKEKFDPAALRAWSEALIASVAGAGNHSAR
jgi:ferric-dicitrate binding protein FerR (iron transport regulator)